MQFFNHQRHKGHEGGRTVSGSFQYGNFNNYIRDLIKDLPFIPVGKKTIIAAKVAVLSINVPVMVILHILSGEIMLAAIPFTRLAHMLWFFFSRAYMGSEFGAVRNARDW